MVAGVLEGWTFPAIGMLSRQRAQVTAGGVPLTELFPSSMESRTNSGVYLAGKQLDVDEDYGGFNSHRAWISGMAAGKSVAVAAKEENV